MMDIETKKSIENQIMTMLRIIVNEVKSESECLVTKTLEKILVLRKTMDYCRVNSLDIPDKECIISYQWELHD